MAVCLFYLPYLYFFLCQTQCVQFAVHLYITECRLHGLLRTSCCLSPVDGCLRRAARCVFPFPLPLHGLRRDACVNNIILTNFSTDNIIVIPGDATPFPIGGSCDIIRATSYKVNLSPASGVVITIINILLISTKA